MFPELCLYINASLTEDTWKCCRLIEGAMIYRARLDDTIILRPGELRKVRPLVPDWRWHWTNLRASGPCLFKHNFDDPGSRCQRLMVYYKSRYPGLGRRRIHVISLPHLSIERKPRHRSRLYVQDKRVRTSGSNFVSTIQSITANHQYLSSHLSKPSAPHPSLSHSHNLRHSSTCIISSD